MYPIFLSSLCLISHFPSPSPAILHFTSSDIPDSFCFCVSYVVSSLSVVLSPLSHFPCSLWLKLRILVWALLPLGSHAFDAELDDSATCYWSLAFTITEPIANIYCNYWINVLLPPTEFKFLKGKIYVLAGESHCISSPSTILGNRRHLAHACWMYDWMEKWMTDCFHISVYVAFTVQYYHSKRWQRLTPWLTWPGVMIAWLLSTCSYVKWVMKPCFEKTREGKQLLN